MGGVVEGAGARDSLRSGGSQAVCTLPKHSVNWTGLLRGSKVGQRAWIHPEGQKQPMS